MLHRMQYCPGLVYKTGCDSRSACLRHLRSCSDDASRYERECRNEGTGRVAYLTLHA